MKRRIKRYIIGLIVTAIVTKVVNMLFGEDEQTA